MKVLFCSLSVAGLAGLLASAVRTPMTGAASAAVAAAETFTVDNVHSGVIFHAKHLGISEFYGRFDRISDESRLVLDADPAKSSIILVVEADSVNTNNSDRDKHLRSGDFFNSKEFPEILFESTRIAKTGENAFEVTGDLTFHGVTRPVTAKVHQVGKGDNPAMGDHRAGFVAEFEILMPDYEIAMAKQNPGAVGPEVGLIVSLECVREK